MEKAMMLNTYHHKLELNNWKESKTCAPCYESLQHHFTFINSCLNVEEKIKGQYQIQSTDCNGQVELRNVPHFFMENIDNHVNCHAMNTIEDSCEQVEIENVRVEAKEEESKMVEECKLNIKEDITIKTEARHDRNHDDVSAQLPKCELTLMENDYHKKGLGVHILTNKNKPAVTGKEYKSDICVYQTGHKSKLSKHAFVHKSNEEVATYKCETCLFQTKHEGAFQNHMLSHKSFSEVAMYRCKMCTFETKYKSHVTKHILTHKSTADTTMYEYGIYKYKTNNGDTLTCPLEAEAVPMYKCDICGLSIEYKKNLQEHMQTHKNASKATTEVTNKYELCPFTSKHKTNLEQCMLFQQSTSNVTLYKCNKCPFTSRYKRSVEGHILTHRSGSKVPIYKCEVCAFQTKHRNGISKHMSSHKKNNTEVITYKCDICKYQTKDKTFLTHHIFAHKNLPVVMYNCELCPHKAKSTYDLRKHMLTHKSA